MKYDDKMDSECVALCDALNRLRPGISTISSCCGHGQKPFRIWFRAESLDNLPPALYYFDACHGGRRGWRVFVETDCAMSPAKFVIEGPVGEQAFADAAHIAALICRDNPEKPPPPQLEDLGRIDITGGLSSEEHIAKMRGR